jgi:Holliday junction resolvase
MKSQSRKAKGSRFEREVAGRISDVLGGYGVSVKRMLMSGAIDGWEGDICSNLPVTIECKNQEKVQLWEWWKQTESQSSGGKIPVLLVNKNFNKEPLAVIKFEDLLFFWELALQSGWASLKRSKL